MAPVTPLGATVTTLDGLPVEAKVIHVDWDVSQAEKGGFPHFMLKEIQETPEAVANALRGRLDEDGKVTFIEFNASEQHLRQFREVRLLGMRLATAHGRVSLERRQEIARSLRGIPEGIRRVLGADKEIARLAHRYAHFRNFMYVGRGLSYPVALEGALKLKEISYLHAEGSSGGELKHGPIALLDKDFPVVAICTDSATKDKMVSNVHEVVARDAPVLAVISEGDDSLTDLVTDVIEIPAADEAASAGL